MWGSCSSSSRVASWVRRAWRVAIFAARVSTRLCAGGLGEGAGFEGEEVPFDGFFCLGQLGVDDAEIVLVLAAFGPGAARLAESAGQQTTTARPLFQGPGRASGGSPSLRRWLWDHEHGDAAPGEQLARTPPRCRWGWVERPTMRRSAPQASAIHSSSAATSPLRRVKSPATLARASSAVTKPASSHHSARRRAPWRCPRRTSRRRRASRRSWGGRPSSLRTSRRRAACRRWRRAGRRSGPTACRRSARRRRSRASRGSCRSPPTGGCRRSCSRAGAARCPGTRS